MFIDKKNLYRLFEHWLHDFLAGLPTDFKTMEQIEKTGRIEIRYLADPNIGSDEVWILASVWFDGVPVMWVTHWGESCEFKRHITDVYQFSIMVQWIIEMFPLEDMDYAQMGVPKVELTEFGNHTLDEFYDLENEVKRPTHYENHTRR